MNWWVLFGCKLTGWSPKVLAQCSEASRSQLSKYTSALLILILIWGVTGFALLRDILDYPGGHVSLFHCSSLPLW